MRLAAIYNIWDGTELLEASMRSIISDVDVFILMYQDVSNFGEARSPFYQIKTICDKLSPEYPHARFLAAKFEPKGRTGTKNETAKRNLGLDYARSSVYCCDHFLFMDCDEMYMDFEAAKQQYIRSGAEGSVCEMYTYFKKPTLRFENVDNYFVPFIHKLKPDTVAGCKSYPFYADPTRRVNCTDVELIHEKMHHFSWIRNNIEMKVRNSSARVNIQKSQLLNDYNNPEVCEGFYVRDYHQKLIEVPNYFNIEI